MYPSCWAISFYTFNPFSSSKPIHQQTSKDTMLPGLFPCHQPVLILAQTLNNVRKQVFNLHLRLLHAKPLQ